MPLGFPRTRGVHVTCSTGCAGFRPDCPVWTGESAPSCVNRTWTGNPCPRRTRKAEEGTATMQARPRGRGAAGALAALACVCTVAACANSAPAPHELERAGGTVYSQAQVMVLVAEAAMRGDAPRPALGVMLDDAAQTLDDERQK